MKNNRKNARSISIKIIRGASAGVNLFVMIILVAAIGYGCYALWDSYALVQSASSDQYQVYQPEATENGPGFDELQTINPEVIAWLDVYGTKINYPVTQSTDNWKYISRDCKGNYSLTGSIFMDYENNSDFSDFNTILYGHNMTPKIMFGNLKDFKEESYFKSHQYGDLYYDNRHYGLQFFAVLSTSAYNFDIYAPNVQGEASQQTYLDNLLSIATWNRDVGVSTNDRIVLLSTCSNSATNERDILVARITDKTYNNEFDVTDSRVNNIQSIDATGWQALPLSIRVLIIVILILIVAVIIYRIIRKRKKKGR